VNALGHSWHPECFMCTTCNKLFQAGVAKVLNVDGMPYWYHSLRSSTLSLSKFYKIFFFGNSKLEFAAILAHPPEEGFMNFKILINFQFLSFVKILPFITILSFVKNVYSAKKQTEWKKVVSHHRLFPSSIFINYHIKLQIVILYSRIHAQFLNLIF
jgi:hypothetical protein